MEEDYICELVCRGYINRPNWMIGQLNETRTVMTHPLTDQMTGSGPVVSLSFVDFWPACLHAEEGFVNVDFERFDVLLPKANCWLRQHPAAEVIQCQTLERKVNSPDLTDLSADLCDPELKGGNDERKFYYVKGLRLWYRVPGQLDSSLSRRGHASQIGYRNYLPRWREEDGQGRNTFEDLSSTYEAVNEELLDNPVEGKIVSVETVGLKLSAEEDWSGVDVHAEQSMWSVESRHHILYITRIFYLFECPAYEQIGASDFAPDFMADNESRTSKELGQRQGHSTFASAIVKVNAWLDKVKDVRITNIQTIETVIPPGKHGELKTGLTFIHRADTESLVRFVRVTYVRPKFGLPPGGLYTPKVVTYRTFAPAPLEARTSLTAQEKLQLETEAWKRLEEWMEKTNDVNLVSAEGFLHSLHLIVQNRDEDAETMSTTAPDSSSATPSPDSASTSPSRSAVVQCIRIYYETRPTSSITSHENKDVELERKASNCALC